MELMEVIIVLFFFDKIILENKGLFLSGINIELPIWIIVDIYGNSVGVEFVSGKNFF